MAGSQYAYDETGAIFNYFLLTFLAMVLIPVTYSSLFSRNTAESVTICKCKECQQKRIRLLATKKKEQPLISVRSVVLVLGWILLTYVAYQVATTTIEEKSTFDPYALLGVDAGAAKDVIKKAWKKKVLFHHTDKNLNSTESELAAHELMTELVNKAYDTLKDPEKMAIWEEWGHPDGKQSFQLGLALPKWLVEEGNNFKVLSIYVGVFMILLPALVAQWWNKAKHMNKEKIMHPTMAKYYRELKESLGFKALLDILCKADEFYTLLSLDRADVPALERLTEQVKKAMEENTTDRWNKKPFSAKDPQTAMQQKVLLLLHSHMLRLVPDDPKLAREQLIAAEKSVQLVGGMLQIAITRSWLNIALSVVDMGQMLTQAVYFHQSPIMQLPYITADKMKYFKSKKRDVGTIRDLLELEDKERNDLLRFLEPEQTDLVVHVAKQYPMLRVTQAKFSVLGEPAIIPSALVTLTVKLQVATVEDLRRDKDNGYELKDDGRDAEADEEDLKNNWWETKEPAPLVHAPYFPADRRATWWVYFGDVKQNRLITIGKVSDLSDEKTVRLQFQAPPRPGQWQFQVLVKSDSHLGCDALCELKLVVEPPEAAPLQEEDDDISDPEEDSIAGQMHQMRSGGGAASPAKTNGKKRSSKRADKAEGEEDSEAGSQSEESEAESDGQGRPPARGEFDDSDDSDEDA